ncbi:MAG: hypothetical protein Q9227_001484 [Pyrenula ochraceoflavens]
MFRHSSRSLRCLSQQVRATARPQRRFLSTAPPHQKSRSWKNSAARWGIAGAGVYLYNTSPVFAEEPASLVDQQLSPEDEASSALTNSKPPTPHHTSTNPDAAANPTELTEEASSEGAFNPITGEINWDCPCLGGMATGPCGEEFKTAFSCFVYSTEEPKGMDCIEKFSGMQECFRAHPDVYAGELMDEDGDIPEAEMDEAMREERRKIEEEVRERRAAIEGSQKRLLEESPAPAAASTAPAPTPTKEQEDAKTTTRENASAAAPPTPPQTPPSSSSSSSSSTPSPHPQSLLEQQTDLHPSHPEHPTSQAAKAAKSSTAQAAEKFDEELELMPKEWHDQRDVKPGGASGKKTEK